MDNSKPPTIKYFGFGTNKDFAMMEHMVGNSNLKGESGKLLGYELCIQKINHIRDQVPPDSPTPISPRELIRKGFGDNFELYVARPKKDSVVYGTIWELTAEEFKLVREWELVDFGMQEDARAMAVNSKGEIAQVEIQALLKPPSEVDRIVEGEDYEPYIFPKEAMLKKADEIRAGYMKSKDGN